MMTACSLASRRHGGSRHESILEKLYLWRCPVGCGSLSREPCARYRVHMAHMRASVDRDVGERPWQLPMAKVVTWARSLLKHFVN